MTRALIKATPSNPSVGTSGFFGGWRTDTRHPWATVRNKNGAPILYVTEEAALAAAEWTVKQETASRTTTDNELMKNMDPHGDTFPPLPIGTAARQPLPGELWRMREGGVVCVTEMYRNVGVNRLSGIVITPGPLAVRIGYETSFTDTGRSVRTSGMDLVAKLDPPT